MVLAPEHPLVAKVTTSDRIDLVESYVQNSIRQSEIQRLATDKEKTGVFTGGYAINPVNNERVPIWIADYVLMTYGTGAIMAVPAHDERDYEFAQKFEIPIVEVVQAPEDFEGTCFTGNGIAVNSPLIDGLPTPEAKAKITEWLEAEGIPWRERCRPHLIQNLRSVGRDAAAERAPEGVPLCRGGCWFCIRGALRQGRHGGFSHRLRRRFGRRFRHRSGGRSDGWFRYGCRDGPG